MRVDVKSGLPADPSDRNVILEAFKPGTEPGGDRRVLDAAGEFMRSDENADIGTGRLY